MIVLLLGGAAYFARRNLLSKTAGQVGAKLIAVFSSAIVFLMWAVGGAQVNNALEMAVIASKRSTIAGR